MKKFILRSICISLYCAAIVVVTGKNVKNLLDMKEIFLVMAGTGLFTIIAKPGKDNLTYFISLNGLLSGIICSLIMIVIGVNSNITNTIIFDYLFIRIRSFLYGTLIYFVFYDGKKSKISNSEKGNELITEDNQCNSMKSGILTRREKQIAKIASLGLTNQEIADQLFISEKTVKTHLSNIYEKFGISSRKEIASKIEKLL